jgi:hypothetical protein
MASFLVGLEVSATTAASSIESAVPVVNRALKSDRLPSASKSRNAVNGPVQRQAPAVPVKPKLRFPDAVCPSLRQVPPRSASHSHRPSARTCGIESRDPDNVIRTAGLVGRHRSRPTRTALSASSVSWKDRAVGMLRSSETITI